MTRTAALHKSSARVSAPVLQWAMVRVKSNHRDLAKSLGTSEAVVVQWFDGSGFPSFRQARRLAEVLRVPFGFLFLREPPPDTLPIPDFRRLHGHEIGEISPDLRDVIFATLRRQAWLIERRETVGSSPVPVVGSMRGSQAVLHIATNIRRALALGNRNARPRNADEFLRLLVERSERLGITVVRSGIVGLNTRRKLDVREFRGFSLSDALAPFVFLNAADAKTGQVFTLMHELTHIWLGQSGISGSLRQSEGPTETLCNQVAAEVLVPASEFAQMWNGGAAVQEQIEAAASFFRVSRYVIAIRAFESGFLDRPTLDELLDQYDVDSRGRPASSGGDFYRTTIARNGKAFTEEVVSALGRQQVLVREAASLLEVRPHHLERLGRELRGE